MLINDSSIERGKNNSTAFWIYIPYERLMINYYIKMDQDSIDESISINSLYMLIKESDKLCFIF